MEAERPDRQSPGSPEPVQKVQAGFSLLDGLQPYMRQERAPASIVLIAINLIVFVIMAVASGEEVLFMPSTYLLQEWGANFGPLTFNGEYWRIFTSCFIHIGIAHLLINMYVLWDYGSLVERLYGTRYYLILYLLSGLGGSCVSLLFTPTMTSAGASGAIFGVVGGLFACFFNIRKRFPSEFNRLVVRFFFLFVVLTVVLGAFAKLDNGAHFGGLAIGFLSGLFFFHERSSFWYRLRFLGIPIVGILIFGIYKVALTTPFDFDGSYRLVAAKLDKASIKAERALRRAERYISENPDQALGYVLKADIYESENNFADAIDFYNKALEKDPLFRQAYTGKAFVEMRSTDFESAIVDATRSIELKENRDVVFYTRMTAYSALGEYEKAMKDCDKLIAMRSPRRTDYMVDRSLLFMNMGDSGKALAELDKIVKNNPEAIKPLTFRAYFLYQLGDREAAIADLNRTYSVKKPASEFEYLNRIYASLIFGRDREALTNAYELFENFPDKKEANSYGVIVGLLAAKKLKDDKAFQTIRNRLGNTASIDFWPNPVAAYIIGDIDEKKVLEYAGSNFSRLTEARAYNGFLKESDGDIEGAQKDYDWVVEKGNKFFFEYQLANIRLKMLEHPDLSN
ncbi:MAG: rhomboid family intramembrane serine protease [Cyanobacteriota/Melainabacteria group bacterium]